MRNLIWCASGFGVIYVLCLIGGMFFSGSTIVGVSSSGLNLSGPMTVLYRDGTVREYLRYSNGEGVRCVKKFWREARNDRDLLFLAQTGNSNPEEYIVIADSPKGETRGGLLFESKSTYHYPNEEELKELKARQKLAGE